MGIKSKVFEVQRLRLADTEESIVAGGRHLFHLLPKAFEGVKRIGVPRRFRSIVRQTNPDRVVYVEISIYLISTNENFELFANYYSNF